MKDAGKLRLGSTVIWIVYDNLRGYFQYKAKGTSINAVQPNSVAKYKAQLKAAESLAITQLKSAKNKQVIPFKGRWYF